MDVSAQFDDIQRLACLGCWEWHVATDRVTWTDGLFRIYGLNPSHFDPTFDGYIARVHADDRERVQALLRAALTSGTAFEFEERILRPDGSIRILRSAGHVDRAADGAPLRLTGVCHDVTVLREAELTAVRLAEEEAAHANRAKSQFLATMSHELRTPLNAIAGYTQLLELGIHGPVNSQQQDTLARIQRNQHRLLAIINDILNFARIDAGRLPVDLTLVRVADLLGDMEALISPQVRRKGLMLRIVQPPESLLMRADAERVEQVLLNLLSNAVKFTPVGGRIDVSCDNRGSGIDIHVTDTGRGIPADRLEAIFDPFVQVDPQLTRETEGIGLGLSISRELARAMNGDIRVRSEPGRGSMFTVSLPAAASADREANLFSI